MSYVTKEELKTALDSLHNSLRFEMVIQTIAIIGLFAAIYFGVMSSNQAAGAMGVSLGQSIEQSREAFRDELIDELHPGWSVETIGEYLARINGAMR